ncbi:MAG TPA: amidophosphoribosyltransferase [Clostridia bacterium]|nr:amidophosphoribosyltransferase [Clostridia bacterium]
MFPDKITRAQVKAGEDKLHEACGVFGLYGPGLDVATLTYYGLYALQHRGQESAGIAVSDGSAIHVHKNTGLVAEVFNDDILSGLKGKIAIGHVRYADTGEVSVVNAEPLSFNYLRGSVALAHNGKLLNARELRRSLAINGSVFQSTTDSEVIVNLIARYGQNPLEEALLKCMIDLKGAYALVVMTEDRLIGVRDPFGIRPLCLGQLGDAYVLASESCALDTIGADFLRDVEPGEIVIIDQEGIRSIRRMVPSRKALCIFEYVYLARPDSTIDGETVNIVRRNMGRSLAEEIRPQVDLVIAAPDSGTTAAMGYAEATGVPFKEGLMKNRYIGRTFIRPSQKLRDVEVRLKLNPIREVLQDQRVALVDDSLVRGTTSKKIIKMLRQVGVKEIHLLISSPPVLYPCYYGIDTSARGELIAAQQDVESIRQHIGADSLHYLSLEGLLKSFRSDPASFCTACFSGDYVTGVPATGTVLPFLEGGSVHEV